MSTGSSRCVRRFDRRGLRSVGKEYDAKCDFPIENLPFGAPRLPQRSFFELRISLRQIVKQGTSST